jgi:asparagine synthase (glutamine-hydrolysing)
VCVIAGILFANPARLPEQGDLQAPGRTVAHRGPDTEGFRAESGGLVRRWLSIIALTGGGQFIGHKDGSVPMVFHCGNRDYQDSTQVSRLRVSSVPLSLGVN